MFFEILFTEISLLKFEVIFFIFHFFVVFIPIILIIAFITLLERKEIATMQKRRGPNVVGFFGLLQPFADGFKLLLKEPVIPYTSNKFIFLIAPLFTFSVSLFSWGVIPLGGNENFINSDLSILFILAFSSINVYGIILSGWSSNSKYAFLGALRSSAQMISYEVSFSLSLLPVILFTHSLNLSYIPAFQRCMWFFLPFFISAISVYIAILAETNRTPFDLPEAEAELVSGYNVEYSSMFFAFFYLAEYLSILLMSVIFAILFFGGWTFFYVDSFLFFSFKVFFVVYTVVWVRSTVPRYRFDQLMQLGWKILLPLNMGVFLYIASIVYFGFRIIVVLI